MTDIDVAEKRAATHYLHCRIRREIDGRDCPECCGLDAAIRSAQGWDRALKRAEAAEAERDQLRRERDEARNLYAAQSELLAKAFQERDETHAELASWTRDGLKGKLAIAAERDRMQDERDEWYRGCREAERQRDEEHRDLADAVIRCGQLEKERDSARQELAGARAALDDCRYALSGYAEGNCDGGHEARAMLAKLQISEGK